MLSVLAESLEYVVSLLSEARSSSIWLERAEFNCVILLFASLGRRSRIIFAKLSGLPCHCFQKRGLIIAVNCPCAIRCKSFSS